jgi:hypothetical protein
LPPDLFDHGGQYEFEMIVVFFSARAYEQDFRKFLLEAIRAEGHQAWHVKVGRRNVLTGADGSEDFDGIQGLLALIRRLRAIGSREKVVYVDTTGAIMPIRSILFRTALRTGTWCFDVYDNLVYNYRGFRLLTTRLSIWALNRLSDITIVLSAETLRLFPQAYHLDNAWDIPRRDGKHDSCRDLVVLSAIDERFDFDFVGEMARLAPDRRIVVHGYVLHDNPAVGQRIADIRARHPNVSFEGRYAFDDVPEIVRPFSIGLTPYATGPMTEFINPDKYYLFLQAGLEVISTDIPQARRMADRLHVACSAGEAVEIARRIEREPAFRKNIEPARDLSWAKRVRDFSDILRSAKLVREQRSGRPASDGDAIKPAPRSAQPERP